MGVNISVKICLDSIEITCFSVFALIRYFSTLMYLYT